MSTRSSKIGVKWVYVWQYHVSPKITNFFLCAVCVCANVYNFQEALKWSEKCVGTDCKSLQCAANINKIFDLRFVRHEPTGMLSILFLHSDFTLQTCLLLFCVHFLMISLKQALAVAIRKRLLDNLMWQIYLTHDCRKRREKVLLNFFISSFFFLFLFLCVRDLTFRRKSNEKFGRNS